MKPHDVEIKANTEINAVFIQVGVNRSGILLGLKRKNHTLSCWHHYIQVLQYFILILKAFSEPGLSYIPEANIEGRLVVFNVSHSV